jgi:ubiquinone biosynthesis protein UbiJ
MGLVRRVLGPAATVFDRRVDWRVERRLEEGVAPVYARQEDLTAVSDGITKVYTDLLEATTDLRRWLADDLDAAQETAALVGKSLTRLTDGVERLGDEVAALTERMTRLETALANQAAPPAQAPASAPAE